MEQLSQVGIAFGVVIFMLVIIFAIAVLFIGATVVINGIPLYRLAKNAGLPYPWLAFLPGGNHWTLIMLAKKPFDMFGGRIVLKREMAALIYILLPLTTQSIYGIASAMGIVPLLGVLAYVVAIMISLAVIAFSVIMRYYVLDDFFSTYTPNDPNKLLFIVLSMIIPLFFLIMLYVHMNDEADYSYEAYHKSRGAGHL